MTNEELSRDLKVLEKYYDFVRVIDLLATKTVQSEGPPSNCMFLKTIQSRKTFLEIKVQGENYFMITAIPVEIDGRIILLELMKSISDEVIEGLLSVSEHTIAKLTDLAIQDALTGIYNRRYIDEQLSIEFVKARRDSVVFSLIMTDIDFFKKVNDQYGHSVGDEVLRFFATQLKKNIRHSSGDWVARYGGEEFLIFLFNCSQS